MLHLFAFKNYAEQLKYAFQGSHGDDKDDEKDSKDEKKIMRRCEYHCDSDGKTPFQLALENQSFSAISVIMSVFKNEDYDITISEGDLKFLMNY